MINCCRKIIYDEIIDFIFDRAYTQFYKKLLVNFT